MQPHIKDKWLIAFGALTAVTAVLGIITFFETREHNKVKEHIALLDREIKSLELQKKISEFNGAK